MKQNGIIKISRNTINLNCTTAQLKSPYIDKNQIGFTLQSGFTLMEMLIAIAIVAILTTLTIPTFSRYLKRAHYTELVNAISPFKIGISECFQINGSLDDCNSGTSGVPKDINKSSEKSLIKSIQTQKGVITATPKKKLGFTAKDTYILTPSIDNDSITWSASGGGVDAGYTR